MAFFLRPSFMDPGALLQTYPSERSSADRVLDDHVGRLQSTTPSKEGREDQGESGAFSQLMRQVEAEHAREVQELRDEIRRLRSSPEVAALPDERQRTVSFYRSERESEGEDEPEPKAIEPEPRPSLSLGTTPGAVQPPSVQGSECGQVSTNRKTPGPRLLKIHIVSACALPRKDWGPGRSSDPYCICRVQGRPGLEFKTSVCYTTTNPVWHKEYVLSGWQPGDIIEFQVKDRDRFSSDDEIGHATLNTDDLVDGRFSGDLTLISVSGSSTRTSLHGIRREASAKNSTTSSQTSFLKVEIQAADQESLDHIKPRPAWEELHREGESAQGTVRRRALVIGVGRNSQIAHRGRPKSPRLMLEPSSSVRLVWDVWGIVVLALDLVWFPMQVFDPPQSMWLTILRWFSAIYWTLDILLSFNTGVHSKQGSVVMDRREVLKRYMRGWFALDLLVVALEWVFLLVDDSGLEGASAARAGKVLRAFRMFRILRLMRLAKIRELLFTLQSCIESEVLTLALMVCMNMVSILALNHLLACLWFLVGNSSSVGWVSTQPGLRSADFVMQYLVSMQWTMAQFTPGASPVAPQTVEERFFSLGVLILGFVVATCFVSNITSTLSAVWAIKRNHNTQAVLLKIFLRQNSISRGLASRVTRYIHCVRQLRQKKVHPSKVEYLNFLSGPLHIELQCELREPQICVHSLFTDFKTASKTAFQELCVSAIEQNSFARNDVLFVRSSEAPFMYFINVGSTVYRTSRPGQYKRRCRLAAGSWCCENVLWMPWQHVGDMKALSDVDATMLVASKFVEVARSDPHTYRLALDACVSFVDRMEKLAAFDPNAVTDIPSTVGLASVDVNFEEQTPGWSDDPSSQKGVFLPPEALEVDRAEDVQVELIDFSDSEASDAGESCAPSFSHLPSHGTFSSASLGEKQEGKKKSLRERLSTQLQRARTAKD